MRSLYVFMGMLLIVACGPGPDPECTRDADCESNQICNLMSNKCVTPVCEPRSCQDAGAECGNTDDGCGGTLRCGLCNDGEVCEQGSCVVVCQPDCTGQCCGDDGCGGSCTDSCAATGQTCNPGTCGCEGTCVPLSCQQAGKACGPAADGCGGTLDCGGCPTGQSCDASGQCGADCQPSTCAELGRECGSALDGCGGNLDCGTCPDGESCDASGQCAVDCQPSTCSDLDKQCGIWDAGCGATVDCGACQAGYSCNASGRCIQDCMPQSCADQGIECGSANDGCGNTLSCGTCAPDYMCMLGSCVYDPDDPPVLTLQSQNGQDFTLQWSYVWGGLSSSQDFYQLQEFAGGSYVTALETARGDHTSPYAINLSRTPGAYTFRVRAWDNGVWSGFSSVVTVEVVEAPAVLRLVNDLYAVDGGGNQWSTWNRIYKVWIADSEAALNGCSDWACGRLDGATCELPGGLIAPGGGARDFDVSMYADGEYWVFMQVGYWDYFCTEFGCCWEEHPTNVLDCAGNCCALKWAVFYVADHHADTFSVNASLFLPQTHWFQTGFCQ